MKAIVRSIAEKTGAVTNQGVSSGAVKQRPLEIGKLLFFVFVMLGIGLTLTQTSSLVPSVLVSVLLFFIFAPLIDAIERKGIGRGHAILGLFLICGLSTGILTTWFAPRISHEVESFQKHRTQYYEKFSTRLKAQENQLGEHLSFIKGSNFTEKALAWFEQSTDKMWAVIPGLASQLMMALFLVPLLTFFMLNDAHEIRRSVLKLVPNRYFETVYSLMSRILDEMGGYVGARIVEGALVGALVTIPCAILGIPYATLFGLAAGATNPIPYLGPVVGAVPGILLAILEPTIPSQVVWIAIIYLAANVIDTVLIFPLLVARIVNLHPLIVILSVILGSQWFGLAGMILAVPITSIVKILVQEIYSRIYSFSQENS